MFVFSLSEYLMLKSCMFEKMLRRACMMPRPLVWAVASGIYMYREIPRSEPLRTNHASPHIELGVGVNLLAEPVRGALLRQQKS